METDYFSIFIKHISGETTEEEEKFVHQVTSNDENAMNLYNSLKDTWIESEKLKILFDSQKGFQKFQSRIHPHKRFRDTILKIAAIFTALISISTLLYIDYTNMETVFAQHELRKIILPDNTMVTLNKNSKLTYYQSRIWNFRREVSVFGEAYFDVQKKNGAKFKVKTIDFQIEVLGTQFNVVSNTKKCEITLSEGKVKLTDNLLPINTIEMTPGEQVKYEKSNNTFEKKTVKPQMYSIWKENKIILDNFSLIELVEVLEIVFHKKVIITRNNFHRLSGSAPIDDLNILLSALSELMKTPITCKNDTIVIK